MIGYCLESISPWEGSLVLGLFYNFVNAKKAANKDAKDRELKILWERHTPKKTSWHGYQEDPMSDYYLITEWEIQ